MLSDNLKRAIDALEQTLACSMVVIKKISSAYDGIVFEVENKVVYKYWYTTEKITQRENWRERFRA